MIQAEGKYWTDKEGISINTFPGSPTFNRIAVVVTRVDDSANVGQFGQLVCTYSDDGGTTWSTPVPAGLFGATFAQPLFLPDGSLAIVYERANPNPSVSIWMTVWSPRMGARRSGSLSRC